MAGITGRGSASLPRGLEIRGFIRGFIHGFPLPEHSNPGFSSADSRRAERRVHRAALSRPRRAAGPVQDSLPARSSGRGAAEFKDITGEHSRFFPEKSLGEGLFSKEFPGIPGARGWVLGLSGVKRGDPRGSWVFRDSLDVAAGAGILRRPRRSRFSQGKNRWNCWLRGFLPLFRDHGAIPASRGKWGFLPLGEAAQSLKVQHGLGENRGIWGRSELTGILDKWEFRGSRESKLRVCLNSRFLLRQRSGVVL